MAERSERKPPSGVSYSKWDRIETSDDESEPAATQSLEPLLESRKCNADRDSDEALAKRFIGHLQQHSKVPVPPALREMVARFVAVTDKRDNASNTFRYADIVAFGARYQTELVNRGMVDALCELHRQMLDGIKLESPNPPKDAVVADMHKLMDAINTLEALRTTTNAAHFFEQVCSPSRSDTARKLTESYQKGDFAKRAMLRYCFKDTNVAGDMERIIDEEQSGAARKSDVADLERLWTLGVFGAVLAALVGGAYLAFS